MGKVSNNFLPLTCALSCLVAFTACQSEPPNVKPSIGIGLVETPTGKAKYKVASKDAWQNSMRERQLQLRTAKRKPFKHPELSVMATEEGRRKHSGFRRPHPVKGSKKNYSIKAYDQPGHGAHEYWGPQIFQSSSVQGVYAEQTIYDNLDLPALSGGQGTANDRTFFGPTLIPPNYCPLEVATTYERRPSIGQTSTVRYLGVYHHNPDPWNNPEDWKNKFTINSTFMDEYTVEWDDGIYVYDIEIDKDGTNLWNVWIYNFSDWQWEVLESHTGDGGHIPTGWNMLETFNMNDAPTIIHTVGSTATAVWNGGNDYDYITTAESELDSSEDFPYEPTMIIPNFYWALNCGSMCYP